MSGLRSDRAADRVAIGAISALAAALLLPNLGNPHLWQDEAQTALIAKTILSHGIPLGTDGVNHFSQELGAEYGGDHVWRFLTWLSFYLVAASFLLFGADTFSARLPFAIFGIATVALTYRVARSLWKDRWSAAAAAVMLALSVPFLVLCRQSRYYSAAAFFSLLGLHAYRRLQCGIRHSALLLFVSATLLFHTHYLFAATLLVSLLIHSALFDRRGLRSVTRASLAAGLASLPWIVWLAAGWIDGSYAARRIADLDRSVGAAGHCARLVLDHLFDPLFLSIPAGFAAVRALRGRRPFALPARTWSHVSLLLLFTAVTIGSLAFLAPLPYFRYLAPVVPPSFLLLGRIVGALLRRSRAAGLAALALWLVWSPISSYLYEITHDFDGPLEGIVGFLEEHAKQTDRVAITYGDLPVAFYTGLRVVGGMTGEDPSAAQGADWVILRRHVFTRGAQRMKEALLPTLTPDRYRRYEIDYPDTAWENRAEPSLHRFRTATDERRVVIFGKKPRPGSPGEVPAR